MGVYRLNSPTQFTVNSTRPQPTVTGGSFVQSGGYHILTFLGNGSFTLPFSATADVLVVAGGGAGGGSTRSGGAGAGGMLTSSGLSIAANVSNSVVVGAGGTKGVYNNGNGDNRGTNGSNSSVLGQVAIGGGRAGVADGGAYPGSVGGSGGGGWYQHTAKAGTTGQGNSSGTPSSIGAPYASGGGGAGSAGGNAHDPSGPVGGAGLQNSLSGASTYYAGGGSGASYTAAAAYSGGVGGGGTGSNDNTATSANDGTNGLGGGGGADGNGGSGIVIIRYVA